MLELKKIVQIIQAWLAYIRLEELTQAEVERGSELYPKVADEGVQLVGNKLVLSNEVFKQFQQQQRAVEKGGRPNDFQMAVAFPQIYLVQGRGKEQKLKYLPCFTIDISKIFSSKYRKTGWDLNEFEFQPVIVNLMRLYGLEEENAESLIVTEGIFKFLEDVFTRKFSTLHDFTDQVDLPEGKYKTSRQPYLLRCDFAPYNAQLKQDLREILEQLQVSSDDCEWLDKNHPAIQYIYNSPQLPQNEVMFWGAFPSHVPDSFQATALKHSQQNYITAVHGSPGTGKTELFLHKVAHQIVERALIIAHDKEDACNLTLFASTNNSAIQKFQQRISDKFPDKHLYLDGGSQGIIRRLTIPKLQSSLDDLRATEFNQLRWEETKLDLLAAEQKIQEIIEKDSIDKTQKAANTQKRLQLEEQIQSLKHEITATEEEQQIIKEKISRLGDYNGFPYDAYEQIKQNLVKAEQELPKESDSITKRAFDLINFTSDKLVLKRLENRISTAILNTFATPYPFQIPLDRESLAASQIEVNRKLGFLQQWQNLNKRAVQLQNQLTVLNQQLELKQTDCEQIKIKLNSYQDEDCCTRFYQDSHSHQVRLFEYALSFMEQEKLRNADKVIQALETYGSAITGNGDAQLKLETETEIIYRNLSLVFPIITSSLQSVRNMLPILQSNSIDLALVDEAGTTLVHQLFPVLVRSKQAVVAGDPKQIEPIINLCDDTVKQYLKTAFIEQGMTNEDYYLYAPTAKYTATAYHRAAGASSEENLGTGIVLRNHYRCAAPIIEFCVPNYPGGLQILSHQENSTQQPHLLAYHVRGKHVNNTNPDEIDAIEAFLKSYIPKFKNNDSKSIGVISPFLQQAIALRYRLANRRKYSEAVTRGKMV